MTAKPIRSFPVDLATLPPNEKAAADAEDVKVQAILRNARKRQITDVATPASIKANESIMQVMRAQSQRALLARIKRKELVTKDELVAMLGGDHRWVDRALRAGRLFSVQTESGGEYFPAFFADAPQKRRVLCNVVRALQGLPEPSIYWFFTCKFNSLQMTPLEALAVGRTREVMACARGFAQT